MYGADQEDDDMHRGMRTTAIDLRSLLLSTRGLNQKRAKRDKRSFGSDEDSILQRAKGEFHQNVKDFSQGLQVHQGFHLNPSVYIKEDLETL